MIKEYAAELASIGLKPIPLKWDIATKSGKPTIEHSKVLADTEMNGLLVGSYNGIGLKLYPPFFMIDFDLKNTDDKSIFNEWRQMVNAELPDLIRKICIESTRSNGYHVYAKCSLVSKKTMLARSVSGAEVISYYTGGVLSFCYPTPGYDIIAGSMEELEELTAHELEVLTAICAHFDAYIDKTSTAKIIVTYPEQYLQTCRDFDERITDDGFDQLLADMTLEEVRDYRYKAKDKHVAYLRKGSNAKFSAKVYYKSRKALLFTTSIAGFPSHADYHPDRPGEWILTPTKIIYYRNGGDWSKAIDEILTIADSLGIEIARPETPPTTEFPYHVFPEPIRQSIFDVAYHRSIPEHFIATSCLWTISSLAGNAYVNDALPDTENIIYALLVAPVSVGKTPSVKVAAFEPLRKAMAQDEAEFQQQLESWNAAKQAAASKKKTFADPRPKRYQPLIMDGTTESFTSLHTDQRNGFGVFYDEAETIFNAGAYKQINDSITFFTKAFSGGVLNVTRVDREKERVIPDVNINLIAGTQPDRVINIFSQDAINAGFPARFLMVYSDYRQLNTESDPFSQSVRLCREWQDLLVCLYNFGKAHNKDGLHRIVAMTDEAKAIYREYYRNGLHEANNRIEQREHPVLIGLGAKMSAYLMRLTQLLAIMYDCDRPVIDAEIMRMGYDLYRYYWQSTASLITESASVAETGLPKDLERLYQALPTGKFTRAQAIDVCKELNLSDRKFDLSMRSRKFKDLFKVHGPGVYERL